METDSIKWLDEEFLKLALSDGSRNGSVAIINHSVKPAVESGNNYCTQLFRVKVDYETEGTKVSKSLIIKAPLSEGSYVKSVIDEVEFLKNEYIMYSEILPELYAIAKCEFGPKTYFCENKDILVMDDLTEDGYSMGDRLQQLDLQHCEKFLAKLAKYHAATVALHHRDPELVEANGTHPLYNEDMKNEAVLFFEMIKRNVFLTILQKVSGMEELVEAIQNCGNNLRTVLLKMFRQKGTVNVLNHGDCWTNNIMFKYGEGGEISDCKLIDFQIRSYGSPAIDLLYFLFTSARPEVRRGHMDELLRLYCDILNETLTELDCKERLSVRDLREDMKRACPWALNTVIHYLPMILNEPDELSEKLKDNKENMKSQDINVNPVLRVFLGKTYNSVLPDVCRDLIELGVVDFFKNISS